MVKDKLKVYISGQITNNPYYLLKSFDQSKGAMLELRIAVALKLKWITESMDVFSTFPFRLNK